MFSPRRTTIGGCRGGFCRRGYNAADAALGLDHIFFWSAFLMSAGAWGGTYWRLAAGYHRSVSGHETGFFADRGSAYFMAGDYRGGDTWYVGPGIRWAKGFDFSTLTRLTKKTRNYFLGFAYDPSEAVLWQASKVTVIVPLWFPAVCCLIGIWWAWRRKRRRDVHLEAAEVSGGRLAWPA